MISPTSSLCSFSARGDGLYTSSTWDPKPSLSSDALVFLATNHDNILADTGPLCLTRRSGRLSGWWPGRRRAGRRCSRASPRNSGALTRATGSLPLSPRCLNRKYWNDFFFNTLFLIFSMNCNQSEQICCFIITYHVLVKYLVLPTIFRIFANSQQKQNYLVDISKTLFVEKMKLVSKNSRH